MSKAKRGTPKGNCDTCSWAALSVEIAKETDGGGGTGKNDAPADTVAPVDCVEELARELWAEATAHVTFCDWQSAREDQRIAVRAIARHVLKHFTRKARP
jgi:hypothetical protein